MDDKKRNGKKRKAVVITVIVAAALLSMLVAWIGFGEANRAFPSGAEEMHAEDSGIEERESKKTAAGDDRETSQEATLQDITSQETISQEAASQEESAQEEIPEPSEQMSILMVGDILLHSRVEESAKREDGSYCFDAVFEHLCDEIQAADLAIVNQEVILGGTELKITGYPRFNAPYEIGDALVNAGFDVVCHATNHALDREAQGVFNTLAFWREHYPQIGVIGIYDKEEDSDQIYTYEENGITVAILNYTYSTNGIPIPADQPYMVNMLNKERIIADLDRAEELADFTIVVPHWGTEYRLTEDDRQKKWAAIFLEHGADLVLGAHPHVIEPIAWMGDETDENQMLIYYSVGNFVNWTGESVKGAANRMVGGMAKVTVERKEDGKVMIADYGVEPIVCHVEKGQDKVTVYRLSEYTEELAAQNAIRKQDDQFSLEYCKNLCRKVWGDLAGIPAAD